MNWYLMYIYGSEDLSEKKYIPLFTEEEAFEMFVMTRSMGDQEEARKRMWKKIAEIMKEQGGIQNPTLIWCEPIAMSEEERKENLFPLM